MATALDESIDASLFPHAARFTVEQYHRMVESGVLGTEPRRFELLFGVVVERFGRTEVIVDRMGEGSDHALCCALLEDLLHRVIPAGYFATMAHPLAIRPRESEPVPDAVVLRGRIRDYTGRPFTAADAALVVEVSRSSRESDRKVKLPLYASAGVPVYWIVDLRDRVVEVYERPVGTTYERRTVKSARGKVRLVLDGDLAGEFAVREILP